MDGQLSRKKVIGSPIYEESLERIFVEGIERFGIFQARKYIEYSRETGKRLSLLSRMPTPSYEKPHVPEHHPRFTPIIYRITEERIEVLDIFHSASSMRKIKKTKNIHIE